MMGRNMKTIVRTKVGVLVHVTDNVLKRSTIAISFNNGTIQTSVGSNDEGLVQDTTIQVKQVDDLGLQVNLAPNGETLSSTNNASTEEMRMVYELVRSTRVLDGLFIEFPTRDVRPHDSWTVRMNDTTTAPQGLGEVVTSGPIRVMYHGVLDTLGRQCWDLTIASSSLRQLGAFNRGDITMSLSGVGTMSGRSLHDVTTGELITSNLTYETNVTMEFNGRQTATIPVRSTVNLNIEQPLTKR